MLYSIIITKANFIRIKFIKHFDIAMDIATRIISLDCFVKATAVDILVIISITATTTATIIINTNYS